MLNEVKSRFNRGKCTRAAIRQSGTFLGIHPFGKKSRKLKSQPKADEPLAQRITNWLKPALA